MRRTLVAVAATAVLALSGCTGSRDPQVPSAGAPTASSTTPVDGSSQELAFVGCMRDHGIVDMPDPVPGDTSGRSAVRYALDVLGKGLDQTFQTALSACQSLLPPLPPPPTPDPDEIEARRQFAKCMRDHGVSDFPDPQPDGSLWLVIMTEGAATGVRGSGTTDAGGSYYALNLDDPIAKAAWEACSGLLPSSGG